MAPHHLLDFGFDAPRVLDPGGRRGRGRRARGDAIRGWGLEIESAAAAAVAPAFVIDVRFQGGLTSAQQAAFTTAAARWARIITADVRPSSSTARRSTTSSHAQGC